MVLRLCSSCTRHVRVGETTCPFCSAELSPIAVAPASPRGRAKSRSAVVFFGAAATVGACASTVTPIYGTAVINDASVPNASDAGDASDADDEENLPEPMYGPAVIDAGDEGG